MLARIRNIFIPNFAIDRSAHRVHTTLYEDLCM
jgi:hypothetical protein